MAYIIPQSRHSIRLSMFEKLSHLFIRDTGRRVTADMALPRHLMEDIGLTEEDMKTLTGTSDPQKAARDQFEQARRFNCLT